MPDTRPHVIFNVLAKDIATTAHFYKTLLDYRELLASDWYVVLGPQFGLGTEIGVIDWVSEFVPRAARGTPGGSYLSIVVADVQAVVARARLLEAEIVEDVRVLRRDEARAIIRDPNGVVLDITTSEAQFSLPPQHAVG